MPPTNENPDENGNHEDERRASRVLALLAGIAAVAVLAASFIQGPPTHVPDIALGWPLVLYLERAAISAYIIMGLGGLAYRLWRGDQVRQAGAGGGNVGVADPTKPAEALKEVVDEDVRDLSERLTEVERKTAHLKPDGT